MSSQHVSSPGHNKYHRICLIYYILRDKLNNSNNLKTLIPLRIGHSNFYFWAWLFFNCDLFEIRYDYLLICVHFFQVFIVSKKIYSVLIWFWISKERFDLIVDEELKIKGHKLKVRDDEMLALYFKGKFQLFFFQFYIFILCWLVIWLDNLVCVAFFGIIIVFWKYLNTRLILFFFFKKKIIFVICKKKKRGP